MKEKFVVIYRKNEELNALVQQLKTVFVKGFAARMSIEDIAGELILLSPAIWRKEPGENRQNRNMVSILIDGTVWSAMKYAERSHVSVPWDSEFTFLDHDLREQYFIRQDDVNGYDLYADEIAHKARSASKVILVRVCIADHNSEGLQNEEKEFEVAREPWRVDQVTNKWIERLQARGINPVVVEKLGTYHGLTEELSVSDLEGALVIVDNHHFNQCRLYDENDPYKNPYEWLKKRGVIEVFRANPPFKYKEHFMRDFSRKTR